MNYAIVLSGGVGTRMGLDVPKQYIRINEKMIVGFVLERLAQLEQIGGLDGTVVVAAPEWRAQIEKELPDDLTFLGFAEPGENRQLSIYNGMKALEERVRGDFADINLQDSLVLVQDAARPDTSLELLQSCLRAAAEHDGAIPVLPMKDTVYMSEDGKEISALLDRSRVFAGQAPEAFRFGKYLAANEALLPERILRINGSTEPAILAGMDIAMIPGDEANYKITTREDLERFAKK